MRKDDLVKLVAKNSNLLKIHVRIILESFYNEVKMKVIKGEQVTLRGFGTFTQKKRASKKARNIITGTTKMMPECNVPVFKPSHDFFSIIKEKTGK